MTDYGKPGKPTTGFPRFPQSLEITARFPHSLHPDDGTVEKWKSNYRIPTFPPPSLPLLENLRKEIPPSPDFILASGSSLDWNMLNTLVNSAIPAGCTRARRR